MTGFDCVICVDWSARALPSPARPSADAIWIAVARPGGCTTHYLRTRDAARQMLDALFADAVATGERTLAGFDFPFGYPAGFAAALTGQADAFAVWRWLAGAITDTAHNVNNRFAVAAAINARFAGVGPFWGRSAHLALADLPTHGSTRTGHGLPERRSVETLVPRAQPVWKLYTTGSVGSQTLLGLPVLAGLRDRFGAALAVWPFDPPDRLATAQIVLAEIYPGLIDVAVRTELATHGGIKDEVQVRLLAAALLAADLGPQMASVPPGIAMTEEGWILGPTPLGGPAGLAPRRPVATPGQRAGTGPLASTGPVSDPAPVAQPAVHAGTAGLCVPPRVRAACHAR